MATSNTVTGTIERLERIANSINGNPNYRVGLIVDPTDADPDPHNVIILRTSSDASYGYELGNPGHREGDRVTFTLTKSGRIAFGKVAS